MPFRVVCYCRRRPGCLRFALKNGERPVWPSSIVKLDEIIVFPLPCFAVFKRSRTRRGTLILEPVGRIPRTRWFVSNPPQLPFVHLIPSATFT